MEKGPAYLPVEQQAPFKINSLPCHRAGTINGRLASLTIPISSCMRKMICFCCWPGRPLLAEGCASDKGSANNSRKGWVPLKPEKSSAEGAGNSPHQLRGWNSLQFETILFSSSHRPSITTERSGSQQRIPHFLPTALPIRLTEARSLMRAKAPAAVPEMRSA